MYVTVVMFQTFLSIKTDWYNWQDSICVNRVVGRKNLQQ